VSESGQLAVEWGLAADQMRGHANPHGGSASRLSANPPKNTADYPPIAESDARPPQTSSDRDLFWRGEGDHMLQTA